MLFTPISFGDLHPEIKPFKKRSENKAGPLFTIQNSFNHSLRYVVITNVVKLWSNILNNSCYENIIFLYTLYVCVKSFVLYCQQQNHHQTLHVLTVCRNRSDNRVQVIRYCTTFAVLPYNELNCIGSGEDLYSTCK